MTRRLWRSAPFLMVTAAVLTLGSLDRGRVAAQAADDVVVFGKDVMIPMRDGMRMATDIYRPAVDGVPVAQRLPVLLQRTPYGKEGRTLVEQARTFARHGYVVALQDERGAYKSEGVQTKYEGYGEDGFDTIEWLARQPYADGQVGMWGTSYAAHTQAGPAILAPPSLKTVVLNCGGLFDGWSYKLRQGGAFELAQQITWAFSQLAAQSKNPAAQAAAKHAHVADWVGAMAGARGLSPLAAAPSFDEYFHEIMTTAGHSEYWLHPDRNWSRNFGRTADIPMLHLTGWYDSYTSGTIQNYLGLSALKTSPIRLIVGPWLHGANTRSSAGEIELGPDAAIPDFHDAFHLRWFDRFLKGRDTGVDREPPVKLFVMGTGDGHRDANGRLVHGGYWKAATTWPIPGTRFTEYYLHGNGSLAPVRPAAGAAPTTYTFDPRDPVPTIGGSFTGSADLVLAGAFDQRERPFPVEDAADGATVDPSRVGTFGATPPYLPLKARRDVVVFQTAPLDEDMEVVGPITVKLFAASSAPDTDFTAKLIDVYPPSADYPLGFEMNLTDGIIRARYRGGRDRAVPMTAGQVYQFTIEPFPTANVFKKGHRIRLDVSSSNFPRFDVNPNTGEPLGTGRRFALADNTIYHDAAHPSHVILPLQPRR